MKYTLIIKQVSLHHNFIQEIEEIEDITIVKVANYLKNREELSNESINKLFARVLEGESVGSIAIYINTFDYKIYILKLN